MCPVLVRLTFLAQPGGKRRSANIMRSAAFSMLQSTTYLGISLAYVASDLRICPFDTSAPSWQAASSQFLPLK
jgi:hypothetical protein